MLKKFIIALSLLFNCMTVINAQPVVDPTIRTGKRTMDNFMSLRFGMFIHWGPVTLRGTEIGWSRGNQVPVSDYDSLFREFDPVLFNADKWAKAAKDAGMKYLVIISKHHDGFCLWPSAYTDYTIANTPFKKDVVGALAKACKQQGIKLGIYYSVLDWHHPDYPLDGPNDKEINPNADMGKYLVYMKNQLRELITRYHPFLLWFDGDWEEPWTQEEAVDMYSYIKKLDPNVIINNRLGVGGGNKHILLNEQSVGDYATPEQKIGVIDMEHPWESCMTIAHQWSWKPNDKLKSLKDCISILAGTAGGNGNLLLNVSPMLDGRMEARQVKLLEEVGNWLKKYGAAIYHTHGGPYKPNKIFTSTRSGNRVNILLLQPPQGTLSLPAIPGYKVLKVHFMGGAALQFEQGSDDLRITLPEKLPDENCTVIVLELDKDANNISLID